jgi:misacylated tRNA(Ala) deacylase
MTEELFRADATLAECAAVVTAVDERGVQLDRTVFYPHGGGQAGDRGELVRADGRVVPIADTRKGEQPGDVVHVLANADDRAAFAVGDRVRARIDVERRRAHMRFHTATHLLCALIPHPVDGCSITAEHARLDFHMTDPLDKAQIEAGLERLVAGAHAVSMRWITTPSSTPTPASCAA